MMSEPSSPLYSSNIETNNRINMRPSIFSPKMSLSMEGKVIYYEMRGLHVWKALTSIGYTILSDSDTWIHLLYLSVICFVRLIGSISTDINHSCYPGLNSGSSRLLYLFGIVFSGYVFIIINRWDRMRNVNLCMCCMMAILCIIPLI